MTPDTVIGVSEWLEISQTRIDRFAAATGDHQWIHVDPEKAEAGPFGATIAHGFMTFSMLEEFIEAFLDSPAGTGLRLAAYSKIRFLNPVPVNSKLQVILSSIDSIHNGYAVKAMVVIEDQSKPACVAEVKFLPE